MIKYLIKLKMILLLTISLYTQLCTYIGINLLSTHVTVMYEYAYRMMNIIMKLDLIDYQYLDFLNGNSLISFLLCDLYLNRPNNDQLIITMRSIYLSPRAEEGAYLFYPHNGLHFKVTRFYDLHVYVMVCHLGIFSW